MIVVPLILLLTVETVMIITPRVDEDEFSVTDETWSQRCEGDGHRRGCHKTKCYKECTIKDRVAELKWDAVSSGHFRPWCWMKGWDADGSCTIDTDCPRDERCVCDGSCLPISKP